MKIFAAITALSVAAVGGYQVWDRPCDRHRGGRAHQDRPNHDPRNPAGRNQAEEETALLNQASDGNVVLLGGFETDPRDGGRPVALIAAALGVDDQVFRDAFRNVRPSRSGPPSPSRARDNKTVLMNALEPHGVSNDRLDEVSNRYRYRPQEGELWTHKPAQLTASIVDGEVTGIEIKEPGYGYASAPKVMIKGHESVKLKATIAFSKTLNQNGRIESVEILSAESSVDPAVE